MRWIVVVLIVVGASPVEACPSGGLRRVVLEPRLEGTTVRLRLRNVWGLSVRTLRCTDPRAMIALHGDVPLDESTFESCTTVHLEPDEAIDVAELEFLDYVSYLIADRAELADLDRPRGRLHLGWAVAVLLALCVFPSVERKVARQVELP